MPVEMAVIDNFPVPTCPACTETESPYFPSAVRPRLDQGYPAILPPLGREADLGLGRRLFRAQPFAAPAASPVVVFRASPAALPLTLRVFALEQIRDWRSSGELPGAKNPCCFRPYRQSAGA